VSGQEPAEITRPLLEGSLARRGRGTRILATRHPAEDEDKQESERPDVDEVDVEPVDLGDEVRQGAQLRLGLAPVVLVRPVAREFLRYPLLHALRVIFDEFRVRPAGGPDARAQFLEVGVGGDRDRERPDGCGARRVFGRGRHMEFPSPKV
jgi:hypothetical protein